MRKNLSQIYKVFGMGYANLSQYVTGHVISFSPWYFESGVSGTVFLNKDQCPNMLSIEEKILTQKPIPYLALRAKGIFQSLPSLCFPPSFRFAWATLRVGLFKIRFFESVHQ